MKRAWLALLIASSASAQRVTGVSPGSDTLTASILIDLRTGQTATKAIKVTVFGQSLTINMYKAVILQGGVKVSIPLEVGVLIDETGCIFTTATDQAGVQLPGLPVTYTTKNPSVLAIQPSPRCPSVTVRLSDVPIPNPTP